MHAFGLSRFLFWFVILFLVALSVRPWIERVLIQRQADTRSITPRGDLAADELTAVSIFESANTSVVDITTIGFAVPVDIVSRIVPDLAL